MANQWFKFYGAEYLSDPKIGRLSPAERSCWVTLMIMASMSEDGIIRYLTVDDLLEKSGIKRNPYNEGDWEACQSVLTKLEGMKMIKTDSDLLEVTLVNWKKRQERNLTPAERMAKMRAKRKESDKNVTINVTDVTLEENRIEENRIEENRIEDITYSVASDGKNVNDVISLFKPVNPSYELLFKRKNQRDATSRLIKKHTKEKISEAVIALPKYLSQRGCPRITTPVQLEEKLGSYLYHIKQSNKSNFVEL